MPVEYYLAPVQDVPAHGSTARGSRVLLYLQSGMASTTSVVAPDGHAVNWTVTRVDADAATHTAIQADNQIARLSLRVDLGTRFGDLTNPQRNAILNALTNRGISTAFITDDTTLQQIIDELFSILAGTFA